jgi:membrane-bound serine protease (ClpP class)
LPGVVGGICLLVGLFALQLLPVNYAGLALMALGVALFVMEFLTAGTAVLGVGGVVAFVAGSIMLIDTDAAGFTIPLALVGIVAALGAAALLVTVRLAIAARRRPVVSGREQLLGATGVVLANGGESYARIEGERWKVRCAAGLQPGDRVRVTRIDGLVLDVDVLGGEPDTKE